MPEFEEAAAQRLVFSQKLSVRIDDGTSLVHSLNRLAEEDSDTAFRAVIEDITREILAGSCLSVPMAKHPGYFDPMYVSAIREGEVKGRLEVVLRDLARGTYVPGAILGQSGQFSDISMAVFAITGKYKPVVIEPEHYLLGLLSEPENDATAHMTQIRVDVAALRADVEAHLATLPRKTGSGWSSYSPALTAISDAADEIARDSNAAEVTPLHFLTALVRADGTTASRLLRERRVAMD